MTNNNDLNGQIPVMKRKWLNFLTGSSIHPSAFCRSTEVSQNNQKARSTTMPVTIEVRATNNTLIRQGMTTPGQGMVLIGQFEPRLRPKPQRLRSLKSSLLRMAASQRIFDHVLHYAFSGFKRWDNVHVLP
jgi:hypothetical protein